MPDSQGRKQEWKAEGTVSWEWPCLGEVETLSLPLSFPKDQMKRELYTELCSLLSASMNCPAGNNKS